MYNRTNIIMYPWCAVLILSAFVFVAGHHIPKVLNNCGVLDTVDYLNDIHMVCLPPLDETETKLCKQLVKKSEDSGEYVPLNWALISETDEVRELAIQLLNWERRAAVCRGMRYLMPIIRHSAFATDIWKKNTAVWERIFDETEAKFVIKKTIVEIDQITNNNVDDHANAEDLGRLVDLANKVKAILSLLLPFVDGLNGFGDFRNTSDVLTLLDKAETRTASFNLHLSLFVLKVTKRAYITECCSGDDCAVFAAMTDSSPTGQNVSGTANETDKLFLEVSNDFTLLNVRFYPSNNGWLYKTAGTSSVYYHTFNKYCDPDAWGLIGDEAIVAPTFGPTKLNNIVSEVHQKILEKTSALIAVIQNVIHCRGLAYVNLLVRLCQAAVRVLAVNLPQIRLQLQTQETRENLVNYFEWSPERLTAIFNVFHREMHSYGIDCDDENAALGNLGEVIDNPFGVTGNKDVNAKTKTVVDVYLLYGMSSLVNAVDQIYDDPIVLDAKAKPTDVMRVLDDIRATLMSPGIGYSVDVVVTKLLPEWYDRGQRVYEQSCYSGDRRLPEYMATLNENMISAILFDTKKITLGWLIKLMDDLNKDLNIDLLANIVLYF